MKFLRLISIFILFTILFCVCISVNAESSIKGDVDDDGVVDIVDAKLIHKYTLDLIYLTEEELLNADINNDGKVDIRDVTKIQKISAEMIETTQPATENNEIITLPFIPVK